MYYSYSLKKGMYYSYSLKKGEIFPTKKGHGWFFWQNAIFFLLLQWLRIFTKITQYATTVSNQFVWNFVYIIDIFDGQKAFWDWSKKRTVYETRLVYNTIVQYGASRNPRQISRALKVASLHQLQYSGS